MALNEKTQKDLHLVFTTSVEDIRFAKKQQWQLTYYALILMAAITYFRLERHFSPCWSKVLIIAIASATFILIVNMEYTIVRTYRPRLADTRCHLSEEFKDIWKREDSYLEWYYKIWYFLVLTGTIAIAASLLLSI